MESTNTLQRQESITPLHWYAYANDTVEKYMTEIQTPPTSMSETDSKISGLFSISESIDE